MAMNRPINGYYPVGYQPYYQQAYQPQQVQQTPIMTQPTQATEYDESIITVRSEQELMSFPVPVGKNQLFLIAGTMQIWDKQMGKSLLEPVNYTRYKLVKDSGGLEQTDPQGAVMPELSRLRAEVKAIRAELDAIKGIPAASAKEAMNDASII